MGDKMNRLVAKRNQLRKDVQRLEDILTAKKTALSSADQAINTISALFANPAFLE